MGTGAAAGSARTTVVACATVIEEMRPLLPSGVTYEVLDFGFHLASLAEHARLAERYGPRQADRIMRLLLKNYTRIALINTGQYEQQHYREVARLMADRFGLRYEEIPVWSRGNA